jgi:hypothetical protein
VPLMPVVDFPYGGWEKAIPRRCRIDRDEAVLALSCGRKVLHIGAVDAPFHVDKAASRELLHQKLQAVAASITGIDSDAEAVRWLREHFEIDDITIGDATDVGALGPIPETFEVIVCCDIIEHVTNVYGLLNLCKRHMNADSMLVVTTINATGVKPAVRALFGREAVHQDHLAYFSYGTLCQLLNKCGLAPTHFGVFSYPMSVRAMRPLFEVLISIAPGAADGILVTARLNDSQGLR